MYSKDKEIPQELAEKLVQRFPHHEKQWGCWICHYTYNDVNVRCSYCKEPMSKKLFVGRLSNLLIKLEKDEMTLIEAINELEEMAPTTEASRNFEKNEHYERAYNENSKRNKYK